MWWRQPAGPVPNTNSVIDAKWGKGPEREGHIEAIEAVMQDDNAHVTFRITTTTQTEPPGMGNLLVARGNVYIVTSLIRHTVGVSTRQWHTAQLTLETQYIDNMSASDVLKEFEKAANVAALARGIKPKKVALFKVPGAKPMEPVAQHPSGDSVPAISKTPAKPVQRTRRKLHI